ncbi:MAG: alpha/beta hydrolase [Rhodomicrobium sp.]
MTLALSGFDFLVLPGRNNSTASHWQSLWLGLLPNSSRVLQADWERPDPQDWLRRVDAAVTSAPRKTVLIAHSLSTIAAVKWAGAASRENRAKVAAVFLAAPTDVENLDPSFDFVRQFAPIPQSPLPFPALVAASRNDPRVTFERARQFAQAWEARLADVGELGHIGNEANLGIWPLGLLLLGQLLKTAGLE